MTEHTQLHKDVVVNVSEDIQGRLNIHGDDNKEGADQGALPNPYYPDRPGERDCPYYVRNGSCGYGSNCRFNHPTYPSEVAYQEHELPQRAGEPDCGFFLKTGMCKYGSTCKFNHPRDREGAEPISLNTLGLPIREAEKSCPYYMRTGICKFGPLCKFNHPERAKNGPASTLPSSGLPTWSSSRASYPQNGLQGYMPSAVISPPQGIVPAQGWNTYLVNDLVTVNPASSTSIYGSSVAYSSMSQGDMHGNGHLNLLSSTIPHYPERPDQPECRYYMDKGTCKYGSNCKYNHPKERISQLTSKFVGPFGLPLRPGQIKCSHYNSYGLCKYGPTCKYDHPLPPGYSYGYDFSMPPLGTSDWNHKPWSGSSKVHSSNAIASDVTCLTSNKDQTSNAKASKLPCFVNNVDHSSDVQDLKDQSESVETPSHSEETPSQPHSEETPSQPHSEETPSQPHSDIERVE